MAIMMFTSDRGAKVIQLQSTLQIADTFGTTAFVLYLESVLYLGVLKNSCLNDVKIT